MLFFVHIPKCGGKSLRDALEGAYGEKLQIYYNNPIKRRSKNILERALHSPVVSAMRGKDMLLPNKDVVYGHYAFDEFKKHLAKPNALKAAFFRDPVEWVGSYLLYAKQKRPEMLADNDVGSIKKLGLDKGYASFLGSVDVGDLDFVGVFEKYDDSLALFEKMFGKTLATTYKNKTKDAPKSYRSHFEQEGFLHEIEALMAENIKIYEQACERYKALCQEQGITCS